MGSTFDDNGDEVLEHGRLWEIPSSTGSHIFDPARTIGDISLMPKDSIRPVHAQFPAHGRAPFRAHCCPSSKIVD